jgi:UDP-glucose 4-epimerase
MGSIGWPIGKIGENNMKVLITGVAGLLGSRLADWIIENKPEVEVIGVDDLSGGDVENIHPKVKFWQMNLTEHPIENIFESHKIDYVFHFAAYAAEGLSPFIRCYNYDNNLKATARIVNECIKHDVKRLVFTSTLAVYGHGAGGVFNETQVPKPIDPYGVAKYACEMDIQIAGEQHGLDWCIIRPHNVYGIKQNIWDKYRNVLGIWMYQHLNGEDMTIFGDGTQTRAFSFIDDSIEPLWNSAVREEASKEIINLGGIDEISIKDVSEIVKEVIGEGNIVHLEGRHEVKHSIPTYQKSIDILGFEHKTSMKEGLTEMWKWAKEQPMKERFVWPEYELDKGIYSYWKNK